jgi:ferric-dicitrate binding protein FerR (iron transport regulator)
MASKKQAKKRAESTVPYIQRVLEDEYVQEQLRSAASGIRAVYRRANKQGGKAAEDKRLYRSLRQAATSARRATTALKRPKPKPKRRFRKIGTAALVGGGGALLMLKRRKRDAESPSYSGSSTVQDGGFETGNGPSQRSQQPEGATDPSGR